MTNDHYYSPQPGSESRPLYFEYQIQNITLRLHSDSGVFSKQKVDFGSDLLIRSLPPLNGKVLDLGCGYGVVGIALSCLNPNVTVYWSDINERAITLCKNNIRENTSILSAMHNSSDDPIDYEYSNRILLSNGFENIPEVFDTIVLNPPIRTGKANIFKLYQEAKEHLLVDGCFYIVIQKKQGMESSLSELKRIFGNGEIVSRKSGYFVLRSANTQP